MGIGPKGRLSKWTRLVKILLLNQCFYPDVVATAQQATDLARELVRQGHEVTVIASRRAYDDPGREFPASEVWESIGIERIGTSGFGKSSKLRRAADFASYMIACAFRLLTVSKPDRVVALTSPPLIGTLAAAYSKLRGAGLLLWVMDLNPDEAVAAGWLRAGSLAERFLSGCLNFSLRAATSIVALDVYMRDRLVAKGVPEDRVSVIPPWPHSSDVRFDRLGRERFRSARGWRDKFVVMYAGNHSPCHPLDTLFDAAERLASDPRIVFFFQGGGSGFAKIRDRAAGLRLTNVNCEPYKPLDQVSASLSAADLHVVAMGDPFVGIVHPSKVYNIRRLGQPFLYIGPARGPVADLEPTVSIRHGDVAGTVAAIQRVANERFTRFPIADEDDTRRVEQLAALIAATGIAQPASVAAERG